MSSVLRGNVRMAVASLRSTRWRTVFTVVGVVVAVVPVLTILSIGEGVKRQIGAQVGQFGNNLITVRPGDLDDTSNPIHQFNALSGYTNTSALTSRDFDAIQKSSNVAKAAPLSIVPGAVTINDKVSTHTFVVGTTVDLPALLNHSVQYGDFFSKNDYSRRTAVVGRGAAESLFGDGVPLGRAFDFRGETFIVRGVLERISQTPLSFNADLNNAIIIPYSVAQDVAGPVPIYEVWVRAASDTQTPLAVQSIKKSLSLSRGGEQDFSVLTDAENTKIADRILLLLTAMVSGVAGIALLVSGISIMNIMFVAVTERMHEIGVRKAIGATKRQILGQFISEAALLSTAGVVIGIALSFVVQYFVRLFTELQPVITWQASLLVGAIALAVGIIFGSIPAIKAARKDPIEALRHE